MAGNSGVFLSTLVSGSGTPLILPTLTVADAQSSVKPLQSNHYHTFRIDLKSVTRYHNQKFSDGTVHSLTAHLGQALKTVSFLRGDPCEVQTRQQWETVHSETWVAGRKSEGVSLQCQGPEARERAQGAHQGLLVPKLTVTQVQTHQLWPEV